MRTVHEMWPLSPSISAPSLPLFLSSSPLFAAACALSTPLPRRARRPPCSPSLKLAVHRARPPSSSLSTVLALPRACRPPRSPNARPSSSSPSATLAPPLSSPPPTLAAPHARPRPQRSTPCAHKPSGALIVPCAARPVIAPPPSVPRPHYPAFSALSTLPAPCARRFPRSLLPAVPRPITRTYHTCPTSDPALPTPRCVPSLAVLRPPSTRSSRPPAVRARPVIRVAPSYPSCTPPPGLVPPISTARILSTSLAPHNVPSRPALRVPPPPRTIIPRPPYCARPPRFRISLHIVWSRSPSPPLVDARRPPQNTYFIFTLYLCHHPRSPLALRTFLSLLHAAAASSYEDAINRQSNDIGVAARHQDRQRLEDAGGNGWESAWLGKDISSSGPSLMKDTLLWVCMPRPSKNPHPGLGARGFDCLPFGNIHPTTLRTRRSARREAGRPPPNREHARVVGDGLIGQQRISYTERQGHDCARSACSGCPLQTVSVHAQPRNTESIRSPGARASAWRLGYVFSPCHEPATADSYPVTYLPGSRPARALTPKRKYWCCLKPIFRLQPYFLVVPRLWVLCRAFSAAPLPSGASFAVDTAPNVRTTA
ncbi:hypothetical protein HYPSUDRAFT_207130 [Hypholoma sublateritium FD-334 SS-4]|uniref:Uncharacterized protein n=1 Tax=Hypholoma sublateritium (strain FD-334 SS-4) TaxID=945553 RepID=A0A0D2NAY3_HYPSF|nr:hypothetical protein HYPSUDRAFT_207130 [Hypholoma sublateritium FD-334 SS-4]